MYDVKVVCYKAGPNGGNAYGTIEDDPVESGRIQINRAETDGIRIEKGFSGVPLITSDVNKLFCGILMTGRQEPTDQTAFRKSPNLIRAIIERDAASDQAQRRLNSEQAAEYVAEKRRVEVGTSNPYLLGKHFYGREREHAQLTRWLSFKMFAYSA
ncbi:MAG: hypothetical protein IPH86_18905 [bacterium]|nr:hypothetical protein [bacterium]